MKWTTKVNGSLLKLLWYSFINQILAYQNDFDVVATILRKLRR